MPAFQVNAKWACLSEVTPNLFISGVSALQPDDLLKNGITCIINCTTEVPNMNRLGLAVDRIKLWLEDTEEADIAQHFYHVPDQIEMVIRGGGKVLVHCVAGVSRSASIVLAYLLKFHFKSLRESFHFLAAKRALVRPNLGFWRQLIDFELELKGRTSVRIVKGQNLFGRRRSTGKVLITDRPGSSDNLECLPNESNAGGNSKSSSSSSLSSMNSDPGQEDPQIPDVYFPIVLPPSDQKPRFFLPNLNGSFDDEVEGLINNGENSYPMLAEQETRERKSSGSSIRFIPSLATLPEVEP